MKLLLNILFWGSWIQDKMIFKFETKTIKTHLSLCVFKTSYPPLTPLCSDWPVYGSLPVLFQV